MDGGGSDFQDSSSLGKNGLCLYPELIWKTNITSMVLKMRCVQKGLERTTAFLYILLVSSCTAHSKLISITTCFVNHDRHSIYRKEMKRQAKQIHVLTTSQHKPFVSQGPVITHRPDWVGRFCWVKEFRLEILRRGNYSVTWLMSEVFSIMWK